MTISFKHFTTMDVLIEKMEGYLKRMEYGSSHQGQQKKKRPAKDKLDLYIQNLEAYDQAEKIYKEKFFAMMDDFAKDTFVVTDRYEFAYLQKMIDKMRLFLSVNFYIHREDMEKAVGILNGFKKNIKYSHRRIGDIEDEIMKIIGDDGRRINLKKVKMRNPQSNTDREINGMTFDREGNKGLTAKKKARYLRMFDELITCGVNDLFNNPFYREKFKVKYDSDNCVPSIITTLN